MRLRNRPHIRARVRYTGGVLTPEEVREHLAYNGRAARVRAVYRRAMGEAIDIRLTFVGAPELTITEDAEAATVTVTLPSVREPLILHATDDHDRQLDYDAMRAWIEQHVDIARLLKKLGTSAGVYWRTHPARRR